MWKQHQNKPKPALGYGMLICSTVSALQNVQDIRKINLAYYNFFMQNYAAAPFFRQQ
jgi:hypothetical protein